MEPSGGRVHLTAERERNLRRQHERLHPEGFTRSGKPCDICALLTALGVHGEGMTEAMRRLCTVGPNRLPRIYLDDGKRTCPTCNGTGINPVLQWRVCPKCNGEKRIRPRGWRGF